jgi:hypothetical protein
LAAHVGGTDEAGAETGEGEREVVAGVGNEQVEGVEVETGDRAGAGATADGRKKRKRRRNHRRKRKGSGSERHNILLVAMNTLKKKR